MDKTAIIWDASDGTKLVKFSQHNGFITVARFSPNDRRVATASNDYKGMIWNSEDGELLSTIKGLEQRISNIEFNPVPSINRVLTTSVDNTVRVWDPKAREAQEVLQITRDSKLIYATWSPDGRMILTCWKDGVVRLYKTVPWEEFAQIDDATEMDEQIRQWRETLSQ